MKAAPSVQKRKADESGSLKTMSTGPKWVEPITVWDVTGVPL